MRERERERERERGRERERVETGDLLAVSLEDEDGGREERLGEDELQGRE